MYAKKPSALKTAKVVAKPPSQPVAEPAKVETVKVESNDSTE
jgi:hypothetical protein